MVTAVKTKKVKVPKDMKTVTVQGDAEEFQKQVRTEINVLRGQGELFEISYHTSTEHNGEGFVRHMGHVTRFTAMITLYEEIELS